MYVVVVDGIALTEEPVDVTSAVEGLHEYVLAPVAVSMVDCPKQMVSAGDTVTTGNEFTTTVTCIESMQPFKSPVTVYVVVDAGVATTLEPVDALSDEEGLHVYVLAPVAVSVADCPVQI